MRTGVAPLILAMITIGMTVVTVYTDFRWGKIFNRLTVPMIVLGVALNLVWRGEDGLLRAGEGVLLGFTFFAVSAVFGRLLGGGDVKLLMAIGALQGPDFLMWTLFYMALVGAALAIALALYRGVLTPRVRYLTASCYLRMAPGAPIARAEAKGGPRLPYAIAIAMGSVTTLLLMRPA